MSLPIKNVNWALIFILCHINLFYNIDQRKMDRVLKTYSVLRIILTYLEH